VVDHAALAAAVKERGLRVGLDVYANEPASAAAPFTDAIVALPGVYGTHHIGASTDQAQEAIAAETVRIIRSYKETGRVPNVVNLARRTPATHMLVVRHRDRPGVLAHVFNHLRQANLNVQETENIVFEGAEAAVARINLDGEPPSSLCQKIKGDNSDVLDLQLVKL
jgi:D-3-phosphoglycerate dehydrogenase